MRITWWGKAPSSLKASSVLWWGGCSDSSCAAGGTQQCVTSGVTDSAWLCLSPFLCLLHSRGSLHLGKLPGTGRGAGISWGEMGDGQQYHRGEWGREGQRRIPGLGVRDGKWQKEGAWLVLRNRMIFPSPSWTLKLETARESTVDLWIYAFTDRCGPDFEIKAAVEL